MKQHVTEQSPSHELFAVLAVDCGWVSNELEDRFDTLEAENERLKKALNKIKKQGCNGPAAYDALDCKTGKIPKKDWCGCCIASAVLKEVNNE